MEIEQDQMFKYHTPSSDGNLILLGGGGMIVSPLHSFFPVIAKPFSELKAQVSGLKLSFHSKR